MLMNWRKDTNTSTPDFPSLSRKEALILEMLLINGRELYGLEMVAASNGAIKRGTIYVTLQRMQEKGLIDSRQEPRPAPEIGIPRRLYRISGHGERVFAAYQAALLAMQRVLSPVGG
jgi:PadR family transcriptional regulator, regulatory protein PadR